MRIKRHFRTDPAIVDYIIADLNLNKINKEECLLKCMTERINLVSKIYDEKLDKVITFMIVKCNFDNMPINIIGRIMKSLTKVMGVINKGFLSIIGDK